MTPRAQAWLRQAEACYLAGQAAEKALKAVLVAAGLTPPYSHSLEGLAQLLRAQGINTKSLDGLQLKALTRMNSESRYPRTMRRRPICSMVVTAIWP